MKSRILFLFVVCTLGIECIIFGWKYIHGPTGFSAFRSITIKNSAMEQSIKQLQKEITFLEGEIKELKDYTWYRERIARQELQMGYPNEEVFLIT